MLCSQAAVDESVVCTCTHAEYLNHVLMIAIKRRCTFIEQDTERFSHCCSAILDLDPENVLSSPGQCHFNEVDSVVMVDTENHLATSYSESPQPSCKIQTGNITPNVSDSLPALFLFFYDIVILHGILSLDFN